MKSLFILNRLSVSMREVLTFGTVVALSLISLTQTAHARLIFTTEDDGVNADAYHLDNDDTSADFIDLAFGTGLSATLRYDILNTKFIFNQDVDLSGNQLSDFVLENQATGTAPTCDAAHRGALFYNTTDSQLQFCDGTSWVASSAPAANSVNSTHIVNNSITADDIGTGAVTTDEILDGTIATADIANNAITSALINDGTITAADLGTDSVDTDEIATGAVTTDEILDGTVSLADMNGNSVNSSKIVDGSVALADLAANSVNSSKIVDNSITAADIASSAVTSDEILDGTITTADINSGGNDKILSTDGAGVVTWIDKSSLSLPTLTSAQMIIGDAGGAHTAVDITGDISISNTGVVDLSANSVNSAEITDGSVALADLAGNAVNSSKIVDGSVALVDLAANAVNSSKIVDGSITAADLGTDSVDSDEIATGAVTTTEILDDTITLNDIAERSFTEVIAPEYPDFTIQADGTNNKGRLQSDYDSTNNRNYYDWSTRKTTLQDYDLIFQWTVPEGFQSFNASSLVFQYKTTAAATTENNIQLVEVKDTTGSAIAGATVAASANTTWADSAAVDLTGGTFTAGQPIMLRFKFSSKYSGGRQLAQLGAVKFTYNIK